MRRNVGETMDAKTEEPNGPGALIAPVAFLTGIFYLNFLSRIILAPLVPAIEADLEIGHGVAGSLFFCTTAGYFVSLVGSGFVSARITHRATIALSSLVLGTVMLLVARADSAPAMAAGMFCIGLGAGAYLPSGIATITDLVPAGRWGRSLAVHELAPNLAFMTAPLLAEAFLGFFSWRGVMTAIGAGALLAGAVFSRMPRWGGFYGRQPALGTAVGLFRDRRFVIITILFSLGIGSTIGIYAMLPLFLVAVHGMERVDANALVAASRFLTLLTVFLGGWAVDRFGGRRTIRFVFFVTGSMTILLGVLPTTWIRWAVLLQPLLAVCFFPAGFAVLSGIVPAESRNVAISLSIPLAFVVGAGLVPAGIGVLGDAEMFPGGFLAAGCLIFGGSLLAGFLRPPPAATEPTSEKPGADSA